MKKMSWAALTVRLVILISVPAFADDTTVEAWCVGSADGPTYAFNNKDEATDCRTQIRTDGWSCRQYGKVRRCLTTESIVDACQSADCQCDPNLPSVGNWE